MTKKTIADAYEDYLAWKKETEERTGVKPQFSFAEFIKANGY